MSLNHGDRRVLKQGALISVLLIGAIGVVPRLNTGVRARWSVLVAQRSLLDRTEVELAGAPALERQAALVKNDLGGLASQLVTGRTPMEAAANLGTSIEIAAARTGLRIVEVIAAPDSMTAGPLSRISVRVMSDGTVAATIQFFAALETIASALEVAQVRLGAAESAEAGQPAVLRAETLIQGWFVDHERPEGNRP